MSYIQATGKRKTSIARVFLKEGEGNIEINGGRTLQDYFPRDTHQRSALAALSLTEKLASFDIKVNVQGGGITGQAEAMRHGIAKALLEVDETLRPTLKAEGLLTRDARIVERKKYGRHKARKSCQFSKR
jgi:small subunit ribosomal protein S9